jgi:hypothetical protein
MWALYVAVFAPSVISGAVAAWAVIVHQNSWTKTWPGSHVGSQLGGLSQTTADDGKRAQAWRDSIRRPACDS